MSDLSNFERFKVSEGNEINEKKSNYYENIFEERMIELNKLNADLNRIREIKIKMKYGEFVDASDMEMIVLYEKDPDYFIKEYGNIYYNFQDNLTHINVEGQDNFNIKEFIFNKFSLVSNLLKYRRLIEFDEIHYEFRNKFQEIYIELLNKIKNGEDFSVEILLLENLEQKSMLYRQILNDNQKKEKMNFIELNRKRYEQIAEKVVKEMESPYFKSGNENKDNPMMKIFLNILEERRQEMEKIRQEMEKLSIYVSEEKPFSDVSVATMSRLLRMQMDLFSIKKTNSDALKFDSLISIYDPCVVSDPEVIELLNKIVVGLRANDENIEQLTDLLISKIFDNIMKYENWRGNLKIQAINDLEDSKKR